VAVIQQCQATPHQDDPSEDAPGETSTKQPHKENTAGSRQLRGQQNVERINRKSNLTCSECAMALHSSDVHALTQLQDQAWTPLLRIHWWTQQLKIMPECRL
jgi:hypothetical protein